VNDLAVFQFNFEACGREEFLNRTSHLNEILRSHVDNLGNDAILAILSEESKAPVSYGFSAPLSRNVDKTNFG